MLLVVLLVTGITVLSSMLYVDFKAVPLNTTLSFWEIVLYLFAYLLSFLMSDMLNMHKIRGKS